MPVVSYHSCLIGESASPTGATGTTSSQILLSRGVAGSDSKSAPAPRPPASTTIASVFESGTKHIMTLGDAACHTISTEWERGGDREAGMSGDGVESKPTSCTVRNEDPFALSSSPGSSSFNSKCIDDHTLKPCGEAKRRHTQHYQYVSVQDYQDQPEATSVIDKGKEVERGRSLKRKLHHADPFAKAESQNRGHKYSTMAVDVRPIQRRATSRSSTFFDNPNDPAAVLEDRLLEPCPHEKIRESVSEVLSTPITSLPSSITTVTGHLSRSLSNIFGESRPTAPPSIPRSQSLARLFPDLPEDELEHIASSSPLWSAQTSPAPPLPPPPQPKKVHSIASTLATEIIQQIMHNISPADFNAARHTCRTWFINSLNQALLETMLRRGGFSSSIIRRSNNVFQSQLTVSDEWLMSKIISRECALGPDWTGNGLNRRPDALPDFAKSAFMRTSTVDFTEVAVNYPGPNSCGTIFTVSSCGKFLMAANGCLVYIYELNQSHKVEEFDRTPVPGALRPVTTIICPRRVLACSMDTSSYRYAIAVLLDGRMGLVSDITVLNDSPPGPSSSRNSRNSPTKKRDSNTTSVLSGDISSTGELQGTSFLDRISLNSSSTNLGADRPTVDPPFVFLGIATAGTTFAPIDASSWLGAADLSQSSVSRDPLERKPKPELNTYSMPIENGPRSLYRNLCSDDDPPRSVAICPQRRCVAFGCSSGIELHWVDALTGQDLNRWFPLTAPSDFLYFLPPRKSVDSAKKLRLISSAAKPSERAAIAQRQFRSRSRSSPFWDRFGTGADPLNDEFESSQALLARLRGENGNGRSSMGRMEVSDHYRAVPLSDGYHILFTDPSTGLLCLGSDAPVGGPTKLLRKMWFQGPTGQGSPVVYAAGSDLRFGVRVVAAWGTGAQQSIWLFSIPPDVFTANHTASLPTATQWLSTGRLNPSSSSPSSQSTKWANWWTDDGLQEWLNNVQSPSPGILPRSIWPVKIRGQKIGACNGVVDLAVEAGGDMTVWALSRHGIAKVWGLDFGRGKNGGGGGGVKRRWVVRDGTVRESEGDGDTEMGEGGMELCSPGTAVEKAEVGGAESYDGTSSPSRSSIHVFKRQKVKYRGRNLFPPARKQIVRIRVREVEPESDEEVEIDKDGDVVMKDCFSGGEGERERERERGKRKSIDSLEEIMMELREGRVSVKEHVWSLRGDVRGRVGVLEDGEGLVRIDVEIR